MQLPVRVLQVRVLYFEADMAQEQQQWDASLAASHAGIQLYQQHSLDTKSGKCNLANPLLMSHLKHSMLKS